MIACLSAGSRVAVAHQAQGSSTQQVLGPRIVSLSMLNNEEKRIEDLTRHNRKSRDTGRTTRQKINTETVTGLCLKYS